MENLSIGSAKLSKGWILAIASLAQFMVMIDLSVVNVALPAIRSGLGFTPANLPWVVDAYTLTFGGFLLLGGRMADLLGQRRVFVAGLIVFASASLAGGLSQSQGMLVVARGIQGMGAALVAPATLAIVATTFAEGSERNRALAIWSIFGALGGTTGVTVGGVVTELFGWQWVLIINVPLGVLGALTALRFIAPDLVGHSGPRHYDVAGSVAVTAGLVIATFVIMRSSVMGWGSAATILPGALAVALLALFVHIERHAPQPLLPLGMFRSRTLCASNVVVVTHGTGAFAMWYFLSLYLQQVLGFTPIETGLSFLPLTAAIMVASGVAGRLASRFGPGRVLAVGMSAFGAGMLGLSQISPTGTYAGDVLLPGVLTTAGVGLAFVPAMISAVAGVARADAGLAGGIVNTARQAGGSFGLAVLVTLANGSVNSTSVHVHQDPVALTDAFRRGLLGGACFVLAGAVIAATFLGRVGSTQPHQTIKVATSAED